MRNLTSLAITLLLSVALASTAQAKAKVGPGTKAIRKANTTIRGLLDRKVPAGSAAETKLAAQVTTKVRAILDIQELGRRAMVDHWKKITAAQRRQFSDLLRKLVEQNYIKGLRANLNYSVEYTGESVKSVYSAEPKKVRELLVKTEIKTKRRGRPFTISIDYVMRSEKGAWRAFDIITDGVSLIDNYRSQFNKLIAKEGFDGLIKRMKRKYEQVEE